MKRLIVNRDKLSMADIHGKVTRVKCFIVNSKGEFMLATTNEGCYQLPGGHVKRGESAVTALKREIKEEAGIELCDDEIVECFYERCTYMKNYFNTGKNKLSKVMYYFVKTDKSIDLTNTDMTEQEINVGYSIKRLTLDDMENALQGNIDNNPVEIFRVVSSETLQALQELKSYLKNIEYDTTKLN